MLSWKNNDYLYGITSNFEYKENIAAFDIDGTIAEKGVVPKSVIEGIEHLHKKGYITTVSTGRGYTRLKEALGKLLIR